MVAYQMQLEMHELSSVVGVHQHSSGSELLILSRDLGEVQILHAHGYVLHDAHHHFIVQLNCFIVYEAAQRAPLWADHHLCANIPTS